MAEKQITPKIIPIDAIRKTLQKHINKQAEELSKITTKLNIISEFNDKDYTIFSDADIKKILSLTCYNNIAYCCGLQKVCIWRDAVLNLLQLTPEEYIKAKNQCQRYLLGRKIE